MHCPPPPISGFNLMPLSSCGWDESSACMETWSQLPRAFEKCYYSMRGPYHTSLLMSEMSLSSWSLKPCGDFSSKTTSLAVLWYITYDNLAKSLPEGPKIAWSLQLSGTKQGWPCLVHEWDTINEVQGCYAELFLPWKQGLHKLAMTPSSTNLAYSNYNIEFKSNFFHLIFGSGYPALNTSGS